MKCKMCGSGHTDSAGTCFACGYNHIAGAYDSNFIPSMSRRPLEPVKTLRDEFAKAAMQGMLSNIKSIIPTKDEDGMTVGEMILRRAYDYAEFAIAEKKRREDADAPNN